MTVVRAPVVQDESVVEYVDRTVVLRQRFERALRGQPAAVARITARRIPIVAVLTLGDEKERGMQDRRRGIAGRADDRQDDCRPDEGVVDCGPTPPNSIEFGDPTFGAAR
jgi:hypothetical protein